VTCANSRVCTPTFAAWPSINHFVSFIYYQLRRWLYNTL